MKWQLTEETLELCQTLHRLERQRWWFWDRKRFQKMKVFLNRIAESGEAGAVGAVAGFVFSVSPEVRLVAGNAVGRLLASVPIEDLIHLNKVFYRSWSRQADKFWHRLQPADLNALIVDDSTRAPVLGLLSFHRSGYVRHAAVRLLADIRDGTELPYLLIRQNDWVDAVSRDACSAVERRVVGDNLVTLIRYMPLIVHLLAAKRRDSSSVMRRVLEMLVQPAHEKHLTAVLNSENRAVRRWIAQHALALEGEHRATVIRVAAMSSDAVLRLWACQATPAVFSTEDQAQVLRKLRKDKSRFVRSTAYWNAAQAHPEDAPAIWHEALLDQSAAIREMAQAQLAKLGTVDVASVYRDAIARNPDNLPALTGLGETGSKSDLPLLRRYLAAGLPSRRRAAIRGVAHIGSEGVVDDLVASLRDDNRSVTREAQRLLGKQGRQLNGESLIAVVNEDNRRHCREAAVRLIVSLGKWRSLPWLIEAAGHPDPHTASLARASLDSWFAPPLCNTVWTKPSNVEWQAIDAALSRSRGTLDPEFWQKLSLWLSTES